jgi:hypothetical protein
MKIVCLLPLSQPSTQHVGDIIWLHRELMLNTLDLWKSQSIGRDVFLH